MKQTRNFFAQNIVGNNVRKYRLERNWSQKELSQKLEKDSTYICRGSISRIERLERAVIDYELKAFAEVFEVSLYDMFRD